MFDEDIIIEDEVITIDKDCLEESATKYFCKVCGFNTEKEKHKKMFDEAITVREKIIDKINVRAIVRHFEEKDLSGQMLTLNDVTLQCNAFEQFKIDNVKGIYAYGLTTSAIPSANSLISFATSGNTARSFAM